MLVRVSAYLGGMESASSYFILAIDYIGTFVFALSGAAAAQNKKLDLFGGGVIALVTSLGGGTLRDILIGNTPVGWLKHPWYLPIIAAGMLTAFFFRQATTRWHRTIFLFDTIGIGLFTILGYELARQQGLSWPICMVLGTISAVFGGVLRDVLSAEIPLIFRQEIYATACLAGAGTYTLLLQTAIPRDAAMLICVAATFFIRLAAIKWHWVMPRI